MTPVMNRRLLLAAAIAAPNLPGVALAQANRPITGTTPDAEGFVAAATELDQFAISTSHLLLQGSTHPQIRSFAQRMVQTHAAMMMERLSMPELMVLMSGGIEAEKRRRLVAMVPLRGNELDRTYVQAQVDTLKEAEVFHRITSIDGAVPAVRAYASRHLIAIRANLAEAQAFQLPKVE